MQHACLILGFIELNLCKALRTYLLGNAQQGFRTKANDQFSTDIVRLTCCFIMYSNANMIVHCLYFCINGMDFY